MWTYLTYTSYIRLARPDSDFLLCSKARDTWKVRKEMKDNLFQAAIGDTLLKNSY